MEFVVMDQTMEFCADTLSVLHFGSYIYRTTSWSNSFMTFDRTHTFFCFACLLKNTACNPTNHPAAGRTSGSQSASTTKLCPHGYLLHRPPLQDHNQEQLSSMTL